MGAIKHQNLQVLSQSARPKSSNWTLQILLPILAFPFLYLYSSSLLTSFNSFHLFFSAYISNLFNCYINRQLMFILCNGLLVLVTQGSGLIGRPASMTATDDLHDEFHAKNRDLGQSGREIVEMKACVGDEEGMVENVGALVHVVDKEEEGVGEEDDGYDGDDDCEMGSLVVGESDQRFEDFIREMKEKMRTEAQQLVLVV